MKCVNFILILVLLACGCQKQEEKVMDLDQMAMGEEDLGSQESKPLQ